MGVIKGDTRSLDNSSYERPGLYAACVQEFFRQSKGFRRMICRLQSLR